MFDEQNSHDGEMFMQSLSIDHMEKLLARTIAALMPDASEAEVEETLDRVFGDSQDKAPLMDSLLAGC